MFTKVQVEIMKVFVSKIDKRFSIKQVSETLNKKYPLIHRSIKPLIEKGYLLKDEQGLVYLNYKENHSELSFVESIRKQEFLSKNRDFDLFYQDITKSIQTDFFVFIVFGSSVEKRGRDIDVLFILDGKDLDKNERIIRSIADNLTLNLDINAISVESAYEMLLKREEANVLNELLNRHIILFGGENFYRILKNARK